MAKSRQNNRRELDINLALVIFIASIITILIYLILLGFPNSYLGILLSQRGFTQYLVVFLASFVIATTLNKLLKVQLQLNKLNKTWIPETISFDNPQSPELLSLWQELIRDSSIIAARCSRIIGAYINSGSRKAATELALDDSSFYLSVSESSYALPRILVWAIPLLGFIGTVLGISSAVNGFSSFLENTVEIDQIKQGISTVTSGLAVAFDTTLLALFLSVVVMIPLVLVERLESRLLLGIDVYLNDRLLPRLPEKEIQPQLDKATITQYVNQAIKDNLPSPEDLIKPAESYAEKAASKLAEIFVHQISNIQVREIELIEAIQELNQLVLQDRAKILSSFLEQQQFNQGIIEQIQELVEQIKDDHKSIANGFTEQGSQISQQLERAVLGLEKSSARIAELNQMEASLNKILQALQHTGEIEQILAEMKEEIALLQPALQQLGKPRIIRLVEQIGDERSAQL
jgi:hypothetical protein